MTIKGTVSRVCDVEQDRNGREWPPRVFFRPEDPSVLRNLDGSAFTASGEIPVRVERDKLASYKVGEPCEFDVA